MSLYYIELQCIWKNGCIFSLAGSVLQKFYPEDAVARGWAGQGAQQSCASGFTAQ